MRPEVNTLSPNLYRGFLDVLLRTGHSPLFEVFFSLQVQISINSNSN